MSRDVSSVFKQALFSQGTDEVFLVLLSISHSGLAEDIHLVNNKVAITSNGVVYEPFAFGVDLPGDEEGRVDTAYLVVDNTDRRIVQALRSINDAPDISISVILASDPDEIEIGPFLFRLRNVLFDRDHVRGQLYYQERLTKEVPRDRMTPRGFPGMYT